MESGTFLWVLVLLVPVSGVTFYFHRSVSTCVAILLGATGLLVASVLVIGLGVGDQWLVYPPWVTWRGWLWPVALWIVALLVYMGRG